jgi:hypothetical protein
LGGGQAKLSAFQVKKAFHKVSKPLDVLRVRFLL